MIPVRQISTLCTGNSRSAVRYSRFPDVNTPRVSWWLGRFSCFSGPDDSSGSIASCREGSNVSSKPTRLRKMTPMFPKALEGVRWDKGEIGVPGLLSSSLDLNAQTVAQATTTDVNIKDALEFFVWAGNQDNYRHSGKAYSNMIERLAGTSRKQGDLYWSAAYQLLDEMRRKGHSPDHDTFYSVFYWCVRLGNLADAVKVFNQMVDSGVRPSHEACTKLMSCAIRGNHPKVALMIYQQISDAGFTWGNIWRYSLLRCLEDAGDEDGALFITHEIRQTGAHVFSKDYTPALVFSLKAGREEEARKLVDQLSKQEDGTCTDYMMWLLIELCHTTQIEAIQRLESVLQRQGIQFLPRCFYILVGDFLTAGNNVAAERNLQRFCESNRRKRLFCKWVLKVVLGRIISGTNQISLLFDFILWIVSHRVVEKFYCFSKPVQRLCEANKYHEALELTEFILSIDPEWRFPHQDHLINWLLENGEDAKASQLKSKISG